MCKLMVAVGVLMLAMCGAASAMPGGQITPSTTGAVNAVQTTIPDPAKSQVTANMIGTVVFYFPATGATGNVNITNWYNIHLYPAADTTYYYNSDSTKTAICPAGQWCDVFVNQYNVNSVTVNFGAGTNYVQGM